MGLNIFCSTFVSVYMPCCTNTNPVAFLHDIPHLCIKVHICFYIFHCQVVTGVSVPFLFSFFFLPSCLLLLWSFHVLLLYFCLALFSLSGPSVSSLEHCSPLTEGRPRSLRSSRSFGGSSVTMVKMTPLSFLPGTRIIKYLGIINMFFIRETTSLREV